jgi:O-glycosyl hydrolase
MTARAVSITRRIVAGSVLGLAACSDSADRASGNLPPASGPEVVIDASVRYQVISGWEAVPQSGELHPSFPLFRDSLLYLAVNDLGLNRLRLEARSGLENTRDWYADFEAGRIDMATWRCHRYAPVNDDSDPRQRRDAGFHFTEFDSKIQQVVLPMRALLAARGESLFLNVTFVAFSRQACSASLLVHDDPEEYAEFVLATVQHMDSRFGLVPDAWEVVLEPDNTDFWRGTQIGEAIVAAGKRLAAHGYGAIKFIAPSNTNMSRAVTYFDEVVRVPGAIDYISEIAYHRYGGTSSSTVVTIANRAKTHDIGTAMLEHIGGDYRELHQDLTLGNATAWQQFAIGFPIAEDNGAQYYLIDVSNPAAPRISAGSRTPYLAQYFRYVRRGAQRIGAASRRATLDPVAFINADGTRVVVVKADAPASFAVGGLPAGRYGVSHTTAAGSVVEAPITIATGDAASLTMPGAGVLTIFGQP